MNTPEHTLSSELLLMFYVHVGIAIRFGTFGYGAHRALIATVCEQMGGVLVHSITSAVMMSLECLRAANGKARRS